MTDEATSRRVAWSAVALVSGVVLAGVLAAPRCVGRPVPAPPVPPAPVDEAGAPSPSPLAPGVDPAWSSWVEVGAAVQVAPGVTVRTVEHRGARFRVAEADLARVDVELVGQRPPYARPVTFAQARQHMGDALLVATNAGMFHEGGAPVGWHVEAGAQAAPLNRREGPGNFHLMPNGAFVVDGAGARVRKTEELDGVATGVRLATQSGPLLCRSGEIHPAFRVDSPNRLVRSGVGVRDAGRVVFAISLDPVRFHELATLLCVAGGAPDALYLDGVVSGWVDPKLQVAAEEGGFSGLLVVRAR